MCEAPKGARTMNSRSRATTALIAVKLAHTAVWAFFVACIVAVPLTALGMHFRTAWFLIGLVMLECAILGLNRCRCPLTDLACRFTQDRADNFDIYLPLWLARHNKQIFGPLYAAVAVFAFLRWWF